MSVIVFIFSSNYDEFVHFWSYCCSTTIVKNTICHVFWFRRFYVANSQNEFNHKIDIERNCFFVFFKFDEFVHLLLLLLLNNYCKKKPFCHVFWYCRFYEDLNTYNAVGVMSRRQYQNVTNLVTNVNIREFGYYIWIPCEKCIQMSPNMPGIGSLICEIDVIILEIWETIILFFLNKTNARILSVKS